MKPATQNHPDHISVFTYDQRPNRDQEIAQIHIDIRRSQVKAGEGRWTDIRTSQLDLGNIPKYYLEAGGQFFIALNGAGDVVGFVGIRLIDDNLGSLQLKRLAVRPRWRNLGIGSLLVEAAINWSQTAGMKQIILTTGLNERAINIYKRAGFCEVSVDRQRQTRDMVLRLNSRSD